MANKIGILGSGVVGQQLGLGFSRLGHEVMVGTRDASKLADWKNQAGPKAQVGSFDQAAQFGEIIFICTKWDGTQHALEMAGPTNFSGKVVVDVTNPLDFSQGTPPRLDSAPGRTGAERIQAWLPGAKVVKAFNFVSAYIMVNPKLEEGTPDFFLAGDDEAAKKTIGDFATRFGWPSVNDLGGLSQAYLLEAYAMLWIVYGFRNNNWTHAFKLLKK